MAVRSIDGNKLIEWFRPYLHTGEAIPADVVIEDIRSMPTLTSPNEWVSVDERLPETAGEYLVVYHPCYWDDVSAEICVGIDSFRGKTAWAKKKYQRVTHWMPLPAPPAKVDES